MSTNYADLSKFKILVDGKPVFDNSRGFRIIPVENATLLLKLLFKIYYVEIGRITKITLIPRYKYLSCVLWNIFGKDYQISSVIRVGGTKLKFRNLSMKF